MRLGIAGSNDLRMSEGERRYLWPLGRSPDGQPSLSELKLAYPKTTPKRKHELEEIRKLLEKQDEGNAKRAKK